MDDASTDGAHGEGAPEVVQDAVRARVALLDRHLVRTEARVPRVFSCPVARRVANFGFVIKESRTKEKERGVSAGRRSAGGVFAPPRSPPFRGAFP